MGALTGIRVVSMAWMFPGPYCAMLLADMGADVIMLERPGAGDPSRLIPHFFPSVNRNKRSITVNLASERGKAICYRLAQRSDIVTEGFRPGVARKLDVDYEVLSRVNPGIIYASISGYGQYGPYRDWPAHDLTYQGVAGILASHASRGGDVGPPPVAIADLSSAMFATVGILAALQARHRTGRGQYIDVSMTDGLVSWMSVALQSHLMGGSGELMEMEPGFGIFGTRDGKAITLSIAFEDHFWRGLCHVIGHGELVDMPREKRLARHDELVEVLKEAFLTRDRDEWVQALTAANVAAGPVHTIAEVASDPHLKERGMFAELDARGGTIKQVAPSLKFSDTPAEIKRPPPELGENTEEVLIELGYSSEEIAEMRREGAI